MYSLKTKSLGFPNDQAQINPETGELWFFDGPRLNTFNGKEIALIHLFPCESPGRLIHFTKNGGILVSLEKSGEVLLSEDGGKNFRTVLHFRNPTSFALNWAVEDWHEAILLGEYHHERIKSARVYRSFDGGLTWQPLFNFSAYEHIHMIRADPFSDNLYISAGDKPKNVFVTDNSWSFDIVEPRNKGLMSIGFTPEAVYFGTDRASGNFQIRSDRHGGVLRHDFELPMDLMIYDFAYFGGMLLSTNRLSRNLQEKRLENKPCILYADSQEVLSEADAFCFTNVLNGTIYTARTDNTLMLQH